MPLINGINCDTGGPKRRYVLGKDGYIRSPGHSDLYVSVAGKLLPVHNVGGPIAMAKDAAPKRKAKRTRSADDHVDLAEIFPGLKPARHEFDAAPADHREDFASDEDGDEPFEPEWEKARDQEPEDMQPEAEDDEHEEEAEDDEEESALSMDDEDNILRVADGIRKRRAARDRKRRDADSVYGMDANSSMRGYYEHVQRWTEGTQSDHVDVLDVLGLRGRRK